MNGSSISLDCVVTGEPTPAISWLKDFLPLNDSDIEIAENGTLSIMEADFEDAGFYTCIADNGLGINQVSVAVDVFPLLSQNKTGLFRAEARLSLTLLSSEVFILSKVCG